MRRLSGADIVLRVYLAIFFVYLFSPLVIMGAATFNDSRFPAVTPWRGATLRGVASRAARVAELGSSPLGSLKVASVAAGNGRARARVIAAAPAGD